MNRDLNQYFTPAWAAELLVQRHFGDLQQSDTVLEPACGDGRFLMAIPPEVEAFGVEIDPIMAERARHNSRRSVICDDFLRAKLPQRPTVVIGNPPYQADLIDGFIDRCYDLLDYDGRIGFLLPVYYLQTASKVVDLNRRFSIAQELLPRNLFENMTKPVMWCTFTKARRTVLSGFFLYAETHAIADMQRDIRALFIGNESRATCWRDAVAMALDACGGRATLPQLYACIEGNRPTANPWWREKVRQVAGKHFHRIAAGEYAISPEAVAA
jgi:adenine-specific DNA-methyltransferase